MSDVRLSILNPFLILFQSAGLFKLPNLPLHSPALGGGTSPGPVLLSSIVSLLSLFVMCFRAYVTSCTKVTLTSLLLSGVSTQVLSMLSEI